MEKLYGEKKIVRCKKEVKSYKIVLERKINMYKIHNRTKSSKL